MFGAVVGHLVIDYVLSKGRVRRGLGGAVAYAGLAARRYGVDTVAVSKVGADMPDEYILFLARNGVDTSCVVRVSDSVSTSFMLKYLEKGGRELRVLGVCEPIMPSDLPECLGEADFIHVGPVIREVSSRVLERIKELSNGLLSLDLQGFIRRQEGDRIAYMVDEEVLKAVKQANVVHGDLDEAVTVTGEREPWRAALKLVNKGADIALVTLGKRGAYLAYNGRAYFIPAAKPRRVMDETGAGDVFTVIFDASYIENGSILEAAAAASAASSFLVEEEGLSGLVGKNELKKRINEVLLGIKRMV